jgi:hypothetical protein
MIQAAVLVCRDFEVVVYLLVDGLSPKRQEKAGSHCDCGEVYVGLNIVLWIPLEGIHCAAAGRRTIYYAWLSSAVKSPSVEQVSCSTLQLKQLFKADLFFFIWASGFGVSFGFSAIISVLIGRGSDLHFAPLTSPNNPVLTLFRFLSNCMLLSEKHPEQGAEQSEE